VSEGVGHHLGIYCWWFCGGAIVVVGDWHSVGGL